MSGSGTSRGIFCCGLGCVLIEFVDARAGFAVDVGDGEGPQGSQIDSGDEFDEEGGQELPVPAEQVAEQARYAEIENIVGGELGAGNEEGEQDELHQVSEDSHDKGCFHARARGDGDSVGRVGLIRRCRHTESIDHTKTGYKVTAGLRDFGAAGLRD